MTEKRTAARETVSTVEPWPMPALVSLFERKTNLN